MKVVFIIVVILHGLIHILGFVKGVGIREVKELSLPISKPMGFLWLTVAVLFLLFVVLQFANNKYVWLIGFIAVILSQVLIILFWKDAKFGTLPNILILLVSTIFFGNFNFQRLVNQETAHLLNRSKILKEKIVSEKDIQNLPKPVKKWLRHSGTIGKPYINIGKISQKAEMKMKPDQKKWMSATALQYSILDEPAFIWTTNVKMNSFLSFQGRDKFEEGKGEMLIKLNSILNVVNEKGKKIDEGSIQRYLGEMAWFPSLALSPYISWESINETSAKATMDYKGTKGSGAFYFNSDGDIIKYSAMRFMGNEKDTKRHEWILLVDEYKSFEGIRVPAKMNATWRLENSDWTWLKLEILNIKYNEKPAANKG